MRHALIVAVVFLALIPMRALPQQPAATGSIEGTVVRSDTGEPIANAQVQLTGGPIGNLVGVLGTNIPGATVITGGVAGGTLGGVAGGAGTTITQLAPITVSELGGIVQGGVRPGNPAPLTTGADGKFSFKDLVPGNYRVAATANGFVRQEYGQRAVNGQGRPLFVTAGQP
jgi:hypothetical protein